MLKGMTAIWKREMRKWWRSRVQLVSSLLLPVLFLVIVGNAYSGTFTDIPIAVINLDSQTPGRVYYESLQNSTEVTIVSVNISVPDAQRLVDDGQIAGFIVIPVNFSYGLAGIASGINTVINVTIDNTNLLVSQALKAIAAQALNETIHDSHVGVWLFNLLGFIPPTSPSLITYNDQYASTDYEFIDFLAPGILAMTILFTSLFAAGMPVILDREIGYFDMLVTTPASRSSLVLGFTFAGVTKVTVQATFILLIALLLGVHMILTPLTILYLYIMVILLALGFVGVSIALSVKIDLTAFQFVGGLINFPVFFLSGAFYPVESLPIWLKDIVLFNPMTYAVHALRGIMIKGTSLLFLIPDVLVVGIFALLTQLLGNLMFYLTLSGKTIRRRSKTKKIKHKS
ncbi:MAG: ABC transporter permease [Promethearchaeota archaeon]